jgi:hypothetical protein
MTMKSASSRVPRCALEDPRRRPQGDGADRVSASPHRARRSRPRRRSPYRRRGTPRAACHRGSRGYTWPRTSRIRSSSSNGGVLAAGHRLGGESMRLPRLGRKGARRSKRCSNTPAGRAARRTRRRGTCGHRGRQRPQLDPRRPVLPPESIMLTIAASSVPGAWRRNPGQDGEQARAAADEADPRARLPDRVHPRPRPRDPGFVGHRAGRGHHGRACRAPRGSPRRRRRSPASRAARARQHGTTSARRVSAARQRRPPRAPPESADAEGAADGAARGGGSHPGRERRDSRHDDLVRGDLVPALVSEIYPHPDSCSRPRLWRHRLPQTPALGLSRT